MFSPAFIPNCIIRWKKKKQRKSSVRLFVNPVAYKLKFCCTDYKPCAHFASLAEVLGALQNERSLRISDVLLCRYVKV